MWVEETKTGVRIPDAPPLDLAQTLDSPVFYDGGSVSGSTKCKSAA